MPKMLSYTPIDEIPKIHEELRQAFRSRRSRDIAFRKQQLLQLCYLIEDNQDRLKEAFKADLGRPAEEAEMLEINGTLLELKDAYDNVEKWAAPERAAFNMLWFAMSPTTRKEPKGVVLLISPFNYPVYLLLCPLAGAIAAGNAVLMKPSELSSATAALLTELMPKYLDPELSEAKQEPDHELHQLCLSPDYVLVPEWFQDTFVNALKEAYYELHPVDPKESGLVCRMVNERHAVRVKRLIDETKGTIVFGGEVDLTTKYAAPTLIKDVRGDDSLMSEELFCPFLPVVPVKDVDEAIAFINANDHPLNIYVFTNDSAFKEKVFDNTQSGTVAANDVILHVMATGVPFGGVGPSGSGYTTGKYVFDTFTHQRCELDNPNWMDPLLMAARYTPYKPGPLAILNMLLHPSLPPCNGGRGLFKNLSLGLILSLVGAVSAYLVSLRMSGRGLSS
ncbi:aldehyde dehydrogenase [Wolfiporia cocos MD-104 SS10]|uniref:Aldehyde dehydrogenase n=1 Tax=Wolfiporia cocos (strain MD-104) TaxID=742152 RepID=A0A2H3JE98_WOLCO|nr:aldehyde dehydrogenase [Wolfiporia cocos MD-104 SS10]